MAVLDAPDDMTLRAARAAYFEANGFGADGGYSKKWEIIRIGGLPFPVRNVQGRVAAIRFHDLHHLVAGYDTDLAGEGAISAFELAGGCGRYWFAWLINFQVMLLGLVAPRASLAGWARGRRSKTLYHLVWDEGLLDHTLGWARQRIELAPAGTRPDAADVVTYVGVLLLAAAVHVAVIVGGLALLGSGLRALFR